VNLGIHGAFDEAKHWVVSALRGYAVYFAWGFVVLLLHGAITLAKISLKLMGLKKENRMLEGNEIEGKFGEAGGYAVDVKGDGANIGKVEGSANLSFNKDLVPSVPGALSLEVDAKVILKADPVMLAVMELKKINSPITNFLATELTSLRAGADPHPAVAQAAASMAAIQPA
jgi:hypothetical protein